MSTQPPSSSSSSPPKKSPIKRPTAETHNLPKPPSMVGTIEAAENKLTSLRSKLQDAEHYGDIDRVDDLKYGAIPELETKIKKMKLRKKLRSLEEDAKKEERAGNFATSNFIKENHILGIKQQLSELETQDINQSGTKGDIMKKKKSTKGPVLSAGRSKKQKYPTHDVKNAVEQPTTTTTSTVVDDEGNKFYDPETSIDKMMDKYSGKPGSIRQQQGRSGFTLGDFEDGQVNFLKDRPSIQTYGRRLAIYLASRYTWYNPWLDDASDGSQGVDERPSLERAWAFFEHVTLPRYIVERDDGGTTGGGGTSGSFANKSIFQRCIRSVCRGDRQLQKAEPGERDKPTKLYSVVNTPLTQMADFGLGYGLYFSTLRSFATLSLVAGLLQFPNLFYFNGSGYGGNQTQEIVPGLLQGSAICNNHSWVPCSNCVERCNECTIPVDGSYYQNFAYDSERSLTFFEAVPIPQSILDADPTRTGTLLNITDYLVWDEIDDLVSWTEFFQNRDTLFTKEKYFDPLEEKYGIKYFEDRIEIGKSNPPEKVLPCTKNDCVYQYTWPQLNGIRDAYLELGPNTSIADNIDLFKPTLAYKNNCVGVAESNHGYNGYCSVATVLLLVIGLMCIRRRQDQLTVIFDEDEQTAQDYSINIHNPPQDAYLPIEWKTFFETAFANVGCKVTVCTVDVSNDAIVKRLVRRREVLRSLEIKLPHGTIDNGKLEDEIAKARERNDKAILKLYDQLQRATAKAKATLLDSHEKEVTHVFITFETELAQRTVLEKLTVGHKAIQTQNQNIFGSGADSKKYLFRGHHVLDVSEPEEPSTIRWQELDSPSWEIVLRLVLTTIISAVVLCACWVVVLLVYLLLPAFAPYVLTAFTIGFPMAAKMLMDMEVHRSETTRQAWLFLKIGFFNIAITALLLGVFTPFHATLDPKNGSVLGLIQAVHALFFSQLGVTPIMQLFDIGGTVSRHVFAPRAKTQEEMNMNMRGTEVFLAERYGNMHKFFFLMLWFSVVYPQAFFMGSFALYITYFVDRFSLMRSWSRPVQLGTQISDVSRDLFAPLAIVIYAVSSSYLWSGFPFDNLCIDEDTPLDPYYIGNRSRTINGTSVGIFGFTLYSTPDIMAEIQVEANQQVYKYCNQDFRKYGSDDRSFPPLPKFQIDEWMTPNQENVVFVFGWVSVVVLAVVILRWFKILFNAVYDKYSGVYEPQGQDMGIPFSQVDAIDSYVPQVTSPVLAYPLLLCDTKKIDISLFNWTDPERPHSYYDITKDAQKIVGDATLADHLFAKCTHWPPN